MTDITVYKCNHHGDIVWQYAGEVVERGATWVCLRAIFNGREADEGYITFRRGDVFTEWFYSDRWYNIFRIADGETGALKGWYCNITRPAVIAEDNVHADDLALDVFVRPNSDVLLLDEDEFEALDLSAADRAAALQAVDAIRQAVVQRTAPFDKIRTETD